MSAAEVRRIFWGWQRPVLDAAVEFLTAPLSAGATLDLADTVVLVPTAEAGRRLRRALADWADKRQGAVSVPHVWPPHLALTSAEDRAHTASDIEVMLAWMRALEKIPAKELTALLPKPPDSPTWSWQKSLAATLTELQEILGAGGLTMADVAESDGFLPESERARWRDLARLEKTHTTELRRRGRTGPQASKRQRARAPQLPEGVTRVLVLAAPDLPPLLDHWLRACAQAGIEVTVAVQAPNEEAAGFDLMGRPLPETWGEDADLVLPFTDADLHPYADPAAQAEAVVSLMRERAAQGLPLALGVCDAEVAPLLKERLESAGLAVFEPGGLPAQQDGFWHLLALTVELAGDASWTCLAALARIKEVRLAWGLGSGHSLARELDQFAAQHLPGSLEIAAELLDDLPGGYELTRQAVREALVWQRRFHEDPLPRVAHDWLIALQGSRQFNTNEPADHQRAQLAWAWLEEVEQVAAAAHAFECENDRRGLWSLVMERLSARHLEPARGDIDLVLQGWLELLWEPAPALLVTGMNEEFVPGILGGHAFLPDSLRHQLALPSQRTRFARDAYLLRALAEGRRASGRLDLLCGRWSRQGEARKPSRLLMLCAQKDLPARVARLFPEKETQTLASEPPRSLAWTLQPEWREARLETISPSRLKAYLRCPFRFYLSDVLRMSEVGSPGREMDALAFGTAIHETLSEFGQDPEARALTEEDAIARWLDDALARWTRARFGRRPPPLVRLQVEAAAQRLRTHAGVEALERQAGWQIEAVELVLGGEDDPAPLMIEGARLSGQVDRVERHRDSGELRLIDFKTSDKAGDPMLAHCQSKKVIAPEQEWKMVRAMESKMPQLWIDLQLPLYAAALRRRFGQPVPHVAYACLPQTLLDIRLNFWEGFDEAWEQDALTLAGEIVRRIRAGVFWPPDERVSGDLDHLFLGDPATAARAPVQ